MNGGARHASIPLAVALVAGLLAAWLVLDYLNSVDGVNGATRSILVAAAPISPGQTISAESLPGLVESRVIPAAYAPVDAITEEQELIGMRSVTDIGEGVFITRAVIASSKRAGGFRLRRGERAVSVDVRSAPDGAELIAGTIVDLVASGFDGAPQSEMLLRDAEILQSTDATADDADARITVRVAVSQAAELIRADVFAREVRALKR